MACNNLLTHTDFNETSKIHTDDSTFQLGALIIQKGKTVDFYYRRITDTPKRYTVTGEELLSIVETLKIFITILIFRR